ncbi:MAG: rhodanese-like domain-containing protein [Cyanobacteria bacterium Co-bin13]|nr:rhodanese-like domain-containing protein [Cyanobacteria bacterium Co-bin13]
MHRLFGLIPKPSPIRPRSRVYDLKERLDWGEPALTIIDTRVRDSFHESHVTGAISMPADSLIDQALASLEFERDLYIYADTDEEAAVAVQQLKSAGYRNVSILRGGVAAWKAAGFPVEVVYAVA